MATILLNPGERFEHAHDHPSTTCLMAGEVDFQIGGHPVTLPLGEPVEVPAGVSHAIYNCGKRPAEIHCGHRTGGGS
mgnify:CR=1 FL=1